MANKRPEKRSAKRVRRAVRRRPGRRAALKPPNSEGARLLQRVPGTLAELAARLGCSRVSVLDWRNGDKTPGYDACAALLEAFAIPIDAWDQVPHGAPAPAPPDSGPPGSTIACVRELLTWLRGLRGSFHGSAASRCVTAETRVIALLHRIENDHDMHEARLVHEHPEWLALKRRVLAALAPYPEAARAVAAALNPQ